ncbi:MAG TPA: hypothetical protein VGP82_06660 [Ktedonobacterales bacterium]|nr:hypothetical protein [Ktedonobacterales bacterium]
MSARTIDKTLQNAALRRTATRRRVLVTGTIALASVAGIVALVGGAWRRAPITGHTPLQLGVVAVAGASVAVADTIIKRAAATSLSLSAALTHPLLLLAMLLYGVQIVLVAYVFVQRWDLSTVGLAQMIIYATTVIFVGLLLFQERLTLTHGVGLALALVAALLMST